MEGWVTVRCENCGDEVDVVQAYDPDYGSSDDWQLVHKSNGWALCPPKKPVATTN